jgi:hypothetical protein
MDVAILCSVFVAVMTAHRIVIQNARTSSKRMRWVGSNDMDALLVQKYTPPWLHHIFQRDDRLLAGEL